MKFTEYQVQPLNLIKKGKYFSSHTTKRYQDEFRYILQQINGEFCLKNDSFSQYYPYFIDKIIDFTSLDTTILTQNAPQI